MSTNQELHERILNRLQEGLDPNLTYHNADHTRRIVKHAERLAAIEGCEGRDLELLRTAALFHDTGFLNGLEDHEKKSCAIARDELGKEDFSEEEVSAICRMIMATRIPQGPSTLPEKLLADADLFYLGTDRYDEIANLLWLELKHFNPDLTEVAWLDIQIKFLTGHYYHTDYCVKVLEPIKQTHLMRLESLKKEA